MFTPRQLSPLVLALAVATAPLCAQPAATDPEESPPPPPERPQENETPPESSSSGGQGDSPFDYRPSEEISEDLPVSFPVDI